jgi:hypothetical protein
MTEHLSRLTVSAGLNPASEKLLSKIMNLEETLKEIKARDQKHEHSDLINICQTYLDEARNYLNRPFYKSRHPHLIWEMLHRVDEYFILLIKDEEFYSKAIDVKTSFDLNIKEDKIRQNWLGEKGKLIEVLEHIQKGQYKKEYRYVVKDALNLINEQMDRTFWQLSMNTLTSVWSGLLLGILMLLAWKYNIIGKFYSLSEGGLAENFIPLVVLGLIGAYLSNLLTREDFLYIRGAPFWRYFLHIILAKPLLSAFAAIFIYILEKSKLIFSINVTGDATALSQIINLNVSKEGIGYTYAILAIISGFAADKILRNMIDTVLKKLEKKAEKTKS